MHMRDDVRSRTSPTPVLKAPQEIQDFLLYRLFRITHSALRGTDAMYRSELGISRREWRALAYIAQSPNASLKALAADAGLDVVVASRCVAELVSRGLVSKERWSENKRIVCLRLTSVGRELTSRAQALAVEYNTRFAECLTDEEAVLLHDLLHKLERQAEVFGRKP
jgi:DNA-binding MarR family transcriptional regulator